MKKRTIMISLVVLGFLLMIGVGFAAWTITNPNARAQSTATVEAYAVQSKEYTLSLSFVEGVSSTTTVTPEVIFGKPADASDPVWLSADADVEVESLKLYLKVSVDNVQNLPDTLPIAFACDKENWGACKTGNYVAGDPTYKINGTGDNVMSIAKAAFGSATEGAASCIVEITFAWGSTFNGNNPYVYYNDLNYSTENASAATTALTAIYGLNGAKYTFTIGTVAPATEPDGE